MNLFSIRIGALLGAIGVGIGAFGAHAFKPFLLASGKFTVNINSI